ncbi:MAG: hypothetical protein Q8P20_00825 [bacterium]|nr:hypothetical protein [bacterium]
MSKYKVGDLVKHIDYPREVSLGVIIKIERKYLSDCYSIYWLKEPITFTQNITYYVSALERYVICPNDKNHQ